MSDLVREVKLAESFLTKLAQLEKFLGRNNSAAGRAFTAAVFDFCCDIIAPLPWAYPAFREGEVVREDVRRAVFRRHYVLLYRITDTEVRFLEIFHTSQKSVGLSASEADE